MSHYFRYDYFELVNISIGLANLIARFSASTYSLFCYIFSLGAGPIIRRYFENQYAILIFVFGFVVFFIFLSYQFVEKPFN